MAESCARCGADLLARARYCTACGLPVDPTAGAADPSTPPRAQPAAAVADDAATTPSPPGLAILVECDACGAGNAASRALCAVCSAPLRDEVPGGDALPADLQAPVAADVDPPVRSSGEGPSLLLALVVLAGLVTAGVLLSLVTSRVTAPSAPTVPTGVSLVSAQASSSLEGHPPSAVIDGDTATSWVEAAPGAGEGEWVEVALLRPAAVQRVIIWNGDQVDEQRFSDNGRAAAVRLVLGDREFRVVLRDLPGPQAIDLPDAVTTDRVRIVVDEAIAGRRYTDLAISEVVVEAAG